MKKTRSDLLRSADLLQALDGVPHGVAVLDENLKVVGFNLALEVLTGCPRDTAQGIHVDFILRSNLGRNGKVLQKVLELAEKVSLEGDIINRSRKKIPIQFTLSPLREHSGKVLGIMMVLEDISVLQVLRKKAEGFPGEENIIGKSSKMQEVLELLPVVTRTDASVLITGETGTGKDLLSESIHRSSKRARLPFVKVNCGALPEALLESELFGHTRGAFTGAYSDKPGMFRLAQGGTIYLNEIGELPLQLQVKLLTVLDDSEFYPLGSSKKVAVDVRVIAATNRDLRDLVQQGKFRGDLYYRLNVLRLELPPLREREGDVPLLISHFMNILCSNLGKKPLKIDGETDDLLLTYGYPGNVRELRNIIEYAANICQNEEIRKEHLPRYMLDSGAPLREEAGDAVENAVEQAGAARRSAGKSEMTEPVGWTAMEKKMIMEALMACGGKRSRAAKKLGWARSTLWRKMKQHDLG